MDWLGFKIIVKSCLHSLLQTQLSQTSEHSLFVQYLTEKSHMLPLFRKLSVASVDQYSHILEICVHHQKGKEDWDSEHTSCLFWSFFGCPALDTQ